MFIIALLFAISYAQTDLTIKVDQNQSGNGSNLEFCYHSKETVKSSCKTDVNDLNTDAKTQTEIESIIMLSIVGIIFMWSDELWFAFLQKLAQIMMQENTVLEQFEESSKKQPQKDMRPDFRLQMAKATKILREAGFCKWGPPTLNQMRRYFFIVKHWDKSNLAALTMKRALAELDN